MAIGTRKVKGMIYHWNCRPITRKLFFFFVVTATVPLYVAIGAEEAEKPPGRWRTQKMAPGKTLTHEQEMAIKQLQSLGYVSSSKPAPSKKGVTIYDKGKAYNGLNLYISGHAPEAILMDMEGNELHKWSYDFRRIWPDFKPADIHGSYKYWRRVHLFENGDLLAIFEGIGLLKLDKDSNLLWNFRGNPHHDLFVDGNGKIYVLTRKAKMDPRYSEEEPILEDFVTVLAPDGTEIKSVSILRALEDSYYAPILNKLEYVLKGPLLRKGDILHTNTIELLDGKLANKSAAFRKGNVLISIRQLDTICVVDLDTQSVVWALSGLWGKQHQPTILKNGHMLLFDNNGNKGKSRIIEFDPFSQKVFWTYTGTADILFFSALCGSSERLPNGNTLISESDTGRAFEITPDKTIVWEFYNPYRTGENNKLIASLFELIRLGPDFSLDWLDSKHKNYSLQAQD